MLGVDTKNLGDRRINREPLHITKDNGSSQVNFSQLVSLIFEMIPEKCLSSAAIQFTQKGHTDFGE